MSRSPQNRRAQLIGVTVVADEITQEAQSSSIHDSIFAAVASLRAFTNSPGCNVDSADGFLQATPPAFHIGSFQPSSNMDA